MKVGEARAAAADWVSRYASKQEGFLGAYGSGSTVHMQEDEELPASSDVDVMVVTSQTEPPLKLGKFRYQGALVEASYVPAANLVSAEAVLADYHLAGAFRTDTILSDPTGRLRELHKDVSSRFADKEWVLRRSSHARQRVENGLRTLDVTAPLHDLATSWLFPTGVTTHVLLAAAQRNPTVRLRYLAARGVLADYGLSDRYPQLLELLGCANWTPELTQKHLDGLARTFDIAADAAKTPFFFSTDMTPEARPIAIDGCQALIQAGNHREAVFWIVATYARCHKILAADASPAQQRELVPAFESVLADLGLTRPEAFARRAEEVLAFLPALWEIAERIVATGSGIGVHRS